MVKVTCDFGTFKVNECKLEIIESWVPDMIRSAFSGAMMLPVGNPSEGDPDMVITKRMLNMFPVSGKIVEYKPPKIDPTVVY